MAAPTLRARTESGDSYDDPSEDLLFMLMEEFTQDGYIWVIVEKLGTGNQQTYAQTLLDADDTYLVERRLGSEETHEQLRFDDLRAAHAQLTAWAFAL